MRPATDSDFSVKEYALKKLLAITLTFVALLVPVGNLPVSAAQGCDEIGVIGFEIIDQGSCTRLEVAIGCGRQETGYCYIEVCDSGSGFSMGCIVY
jgi:hypothetical protein